MNGEVLKDYYALLGVPATATVSEIHKAYWQRAARCHPDRGGRHEDMVQLVEAWKILSEPAKRARYDQLRAYRHDGWQSRKFNADVHEARTHAEGDAAVSWEEFEEIYRKAFYIFNQDFYGEDIERKAAGPYSPLMTAKTAEVGHDDTRVPSTRTSSASASLLKTFILVAAAAAALAAYRGYLNIGRYVPAGQQDTTHVLVLDTASGTVYSVEKQDGSLTSLWQRIRRPPPEHQTTGEK
jgi:curved DNA-binding protein CbpA